jgi:hypothetical protein
MERHDSMSELDSTRLRELLRYNARTGAFVRRHSRGSRPAGGINAGGYHQISVDGRLYYGHRLAWLYAYGEWPDGCVDHVNGDRSDNRLLNLRVGTRGQNLQNMRRPKSTNPYLGVSLHRASGLWHARIQVQGVAASLGYHKTPEAARRAYVTAKRNLHEFGTL